MRPSIVAALLLAVAHPAQAQQPDPVTDALSGYAQGSGPGCNVAAARDGRELLNRSFGLASVEHSVPITRATRFDVASVTKQFTAAAILLLVAEGKISLDDDVRRHIPEFPDFGGTVTVDQLLTHTAGLRDYPFLIELQGWWPSTRRQFSQEELVSLITRQRELNFSPGQRWSYSNSGYILASEIVRRVSGRSLKDFLDQKVFTPLGMRSTTLRDDYNLVLPDLAGAYSGPPDRLGRALPTAEHGDGNLISTPADLLIWSQALDEGRLGQFVTTELQRRSRTSDGLTIPYARGLFVTTYRGVTEVSHSGGARGVAAVVMRYPEQRLAIAVACNTERPVEEIAHKIADLYLPQADRPGRVPQSTAAVSPARLTQLAGLFFDDTRGTHVVVSVDNGKLKWGNSAAEPASESRFTLPLSREIEFRSRDVVEVRSTLTGERRTFRRIPQDAPTADEIAEVAGLYRSAELSTTYRVEAKSDEIIIHIVGEPDLSWPLPALARDIFDGGRDTIRFLRDGSGRAETLLISNARNREIRFSRIAGS